MMRAGIDYGTRVIMGFNPRVRPTTKAERAALLRRRAAEKQDDLALRSVNQDKPKLHLK